MLSMTGVTAWASSHPQAALGGAAALGVSGLALHRRKTAAAASAAGGGVALKGTAGLSGTPDTTATDQGNYFQDQINSLRDLIQNPAPAAPGTTPAPTSTPTPSKPTSAPKPTPKPAPKPAAPAPRLAQRAATKKPHPAAKPKAARVFVIPKGGTLYGAAQHAYGTPHPSAAQVSALAARNGIRLYQRGGTTMADVSPGQRINY